MVVRYAANKASGVPVPASGIFVAAVASVADVKRSHTEHAGAADWAEDVAMEADAPKERRSALAWIEASRL
jgi:hypothetical protein